MNTVEVAIPDILLSRGQIATAVGQKVTPVDEAEEADLPLITYSRVSTDHLHDLSGPSGQATTTVEVSAAASTYAEAKDLGEQCRMALDGFRGLRNGWDIQDIELVSDDDSPETIQSGAETPIHIVTHRYMVIHRELVPVH